MWDSGDFPKKPQLQNWMTSFVEIIIDKVIRLFRFTEIEQLITQIEILIFVTLWKIAMLYFKYRKA